MDWKTFFAEIIKAIAWPGAIAIIALVFRENVKSLFSSLRRVKHGDLEIDFEEEIQQARQDSDELEDVTKSIPTDERLLRLADTHPNLAVIESWQRVEALLEYHYNARRRNRGLPSNPNVHVLNRKQVVLTLNNLIDDGKLSRNQKLLILDLQRLRNLAVHSGEKSQSSEITNKSAYEYVELALAIETTLEQLKQQYLESAGTVADVGSPSSE